MGTQANRDDLVFAGLFGLLAVWPRLIPGLWELVIMHKAGMALFAATLIGRGVAGAETVALVDGTLAAMTVVAYVLTRGYSNWTRLVKG